MRNKLLCSIFILRLLLAEVLYEQDFCQILDIKFKISSFVCIAYESQQNNASCVAPYVRMLIAFSDFTEERGSVHRLACSALVHAETSIPCLVPQLSLLMSVRWNRSIVQQYIRKFQKRLVLARKRNGQIEGKFYIRLVRNAAGQIVFLEAFRECWGGGQIL